MLPQVEHLSKCIFAGGGGHRRFKPVNGCTQTRHQHHIAAADPHQARVQIRVAGVERCETHRGQPAQGFLFEWVYGYVALCCCSKIWFKAKLT